MSTVDQGDRTRVEGFCTADFEAVRDLFVERCDFGGGGGAFCAYVGGEKVVDLWSGSARPGAPWGEDTLAVLASATKGMTTLCAHVLFSRGELDIEAPVASYWPEFASNGKGAITVRQVLEHSSGVIGVADHERLLRLDGTGWGEHEKIAAGIAASEPAWSRGRRLAITP